MIDSLQNEIEFEHTIESIEPCVQCGRERCMNSRGVIVHLFYKSDGLWKLSIKCPEQ